MAGASGEAPEAVREDEVNKDNAFSRCLAKLGKVKEELRRVHETEIANLKQDKVVLTLKLEQNSQQLRVLQAELHDLRSEAKPGAVGAGMAGGAAATGDGESVVAGAAGEVAACAAGDAAAGAATGDRAADDAASIADDSARAAAGAALGPVVDAAGDGAAHDAAKVADDDARRGASSAALSKADHIMGDGAADDAARAADDVARGATGAPAMDAEDVTVGVGAAPDLGGPHGDKVGDRSSDGGIAHCVSTDVSSGSGRSLAPTVGESAGSKGAMLDVTSSTADVSQEVTTPAAAKAMLQESPAQHVQTLLALPGQGSDIDVAGLPGEVDALDDTAPAELLRRRGNKRGKGRRTIDCAETPTDSLKVNAGTSRRSSGTSAASCSSGHSPTMQLSDSVKSGEKSGFGSVLPVAPETGGASSSRPRTPASGAPGLPLFQSSEMTQVGSRCSSKDPGAFSAVLDLPETERRFNVLDAWTAHDEVVMRPLTNSWECINPVDTMESGGKRLNNSSSFVESLRPLEPRLNALVLHPSSMKRKVWDILGFLFVAADVAVIPLYFFEMPISTVSIVCGWISRVFWTLDIVASFLTGIYLKGVLQMRPRTIAWNYLTTWFLSDVLILIAHWLTLFILDKGSSPAWPVMAFLRGARVLRLVRLLKMLKVQMVLHEIGSRFNSQFTFAIVGLVKFVLFSAIAIHFMSCIWYGIGKSRADGWTALQDLDGASILRSYMVSLHWTLTQLHGTSSFHPGNFQEYAFANVINFCGLLSYCYLVGAIAHTMMQVDLLNSNDMHKQRLLCGYLKRHRVSSALSIRARVHFESHCTQKQEEQLEEDQTKAVLSALPLAMQLDIAEEIRGPFMASYGFLRDIHDDSPHVVRHLCHAALTEVNAHTGEVVFSSGDVCTRMFFVMSGTMGYMQQRRWSSPKYKNVPPNLMFVDSSSGYGGSSDGGQHGASDTEGSVGSLAPDLELGGVGASPVEDKLSQRRKAQRQRSPSDGSIANIVLNHGDFVSEAALWTTWEYCGEFKALCDATMLAMDVSSFAAVLARNPAAYSYAVRYARIFVRRLNNHGECSDVLRFHLVRSAVEKEVFEVNRSSEERLEVVKSSCSSMAVLKRSMRPLSADPTQHFMFISHHKADAGTEAALMQEALERMILEDQLNPGHYMKAPVFLDSEDLSDLSKLKEHVRKSRNLVLLLTKQVLDRPWVLIEIVTASQVDVNIVPVEVQKKDMTFDYPDEAYYQKIRDGTALPPEARQLILNEGIHMEDLEKTLRKVFKKIAVPFSPHKSGNVRNAELRDIMRRCQSSVELS